MALISVRCVNSLQVNCRRACLAAGSPGRARFWASRGRGGGAARRWWAGLVAPSACPAGRAWRRVCSRFSSIEFRCLVSKRNRIATRRRPLFARTCASVSQLVSRLTGAGSSFHLMDTDNWRAHECRVAQIRSPTAKAQFAFTPSV